MRTILLLLILATGAAVIAGCTTLPQPCIEGSGNIATETRSTPGFHTVSLTMPAALIVQNGEVPSVVIESDDNILPLVTSDVRGGVLTLSHNRLCVRPSREIRITVTAPVIGEVSVTGTGTVRSAGILRSDTLAARITGAGNMDLAVATGSLSTTITGLGTMNLTGNAVTHAIVIPGAGTVNAATLETEHTTIEITGNGNVKVNSSESLAVRITGNGNVEYAGNPRSVQQSVTGIGSVRPVG